MIFVLKNPVYGRGKLIEKERSRTKTKWQAGVYFSNIFQEGSSPLVLLG